jgi:endo-1,4-beta-xylanase
VQSFLAAMWVSNKPESIITWGLSDSNSWISTTFKREDKLANRPLPLDVDNRPKAMLRVIERFTRGKA